jgi:hypothetical protein
LPLAFGHPATGVPWTVDCIVKFEALAATVQQYDFPALITLLEIAVKKWRFASCFSI